jgi:hypothetical protein
MGMHRTFGRALAGGAATCLALAIAAAPAASEPRAASAAPTSKRGGATKTVVRHLTNVAPTSHRPVFADLTYAQRTALSGRVLVGDEQALANAKARAQRTASGRAASAPAGPKAPTALRNFQGLNDPNSSPSDSTGAIGTDRYVELVNSRVGIWDRTNNTPIVNSTLNTLTGVGSGPSVFDPQVIWDPDTNRFYYAIDAIASATQNLVTFGFSKDATPDNATTDWCKFTLNFGVPFPDYPKLGDFSGMITIGANVFTSNANTAVFAEGDVIGITKPAGGTTCPAANTFTVTVAQDLRNADNSKATTPLPANQVDPNTTGHVLSGKGFTGGNFVSVFNVTKNGSNQLVVAAARAMSVTSFAVPAPAPQPGTARTLDTLDTRFTNAVEAIDPHRSNGVAVWTQHTVNGAGGRSVVSWFEINPTPSTPTPFQSGTQSSASLFLYNASISPDRRRNGGSGQFGNGMLLQYSKSSASAKISIAAVSKVDDGSVTGELVVKNSPDVIDDFACGGNNVCRWGDYAGASPDPASDATASHGVVWGVNAFAQASSGNFSDYRTQIFALQVSPK